MLTAAELLGERQRVLVTGGAGFIGGAVVRRLLRESEALVFNLDKMGYASKLTSIKQVLAELGARGEGRHQLLRLDLGDTAVTAEAVQMADPDLVMHLGAESYVDRSIEGHRALETRGLIRQLPNPPQRMAGRDPLFDRHVGEQRAAALLLTSHHGMGGWPIFAEVGRFFSKLLEQQGWCREVRVRCSYTRGRLELAALQSTQTMTHR